MILQWDIHIPHIEAQMSTQGLIGFRAYICFTRFGSPIKVLTFENWAHQYTGEHTQICPEMHTHSHPLWHTSSDAYTRSCTLSCLHKRTHTCKPQNIYLFTHLQIVTHKQVPFPTYTLIYNTHTYIDISICTYVHMHTYASIPATLKICTKNTSAFKFK